MVVSCSFTFGEANYNSLPCCSKTNHERSTRLSASVRYAQCARAMGVATQSDSDEVANQKLINELKALNTDLQVPTPADFGIDKEAFFASMSTMAEQALASGSPGNNPRVPTIEEMVAIYVSLWE